MKTLISFSTFSLVALISLAQSPQDEQLIRGVVFSFQRDFNDGRFRNAAAYTTADWEHINPGGGLTKGRTAVLREVRTVHQTFLKGVTMSVESMAIRLVTPDAALATVVHKMSPYEMPLGVKHEGERQVKTYVIVKQQQKWLLAQDQNTVIVAR